MTDEEQKDLEKLREELQRVRVSTYDYACSFLRYTLDDLKHSGYGGKTVGEAIVMVLQRSQTDIQKLVKAHERKYPD